MTADSQSTLRSLMRTILAAAAMLPGLMCPPVAQAGGSVAGAAFAPGDIYLVSTSLPAGSGMANMTPGAMHVNPNTGAATRLPFTQQFMQGRATYDPARGRIIAMRLNNPPTMFDADGNLETLAMSWTPNPRLIAPTGCGRLYLLGVNTIGLMDLDGSTATVMTEDGSQPLTLTISTSSVVMIFDAMHNCLLLAEPDGAGALRVQRVTFSGDGLRASGPIVSATLNVIANEVDVPMGFSAGPGGAAFLKLDDNSNATAARMVMVNPQTLAITTFASSGYTGVAGETAGCYSGVRGQAVALDTFNDMLRVFNLGESGAGNILSNGVSSTGGSGELAQLLEIGGTIVNPITCPPPPCPADVNDDGGVNVTDLLAVIAAWGATGPNPADVNNDGTVNVTDLLAVIGGWGPCP